MISKLDIKYIAKNRLIDSEILYKATRYNGSYYLCGYAIELSLKYQICDILDWSDYPLTRKEFKGINSFKTHDLDILLKLSGIEKDIKSRFLLEWNIVRFWNPEKRYLPVGSIKPLDAKAMLNSSKIILGNIL